MSSEARLAELERQLSTLAILQSVYCMEGEFKASDETAALLDVLSSGEEVVNLPHAALQAVLSVAISDGDPTKVIGLDVTWKPAQNVEETSQAPDAACQIRLLRPDWLLRKTFESLSSEFQQELANVSAEEAEDEVALVAFAAEKAKDSALRALTSQASETSRKESSTMPDSDALVRIWMHLPSLSTKSKRNDLVTYAPSYSITGIVHAGKPGLLILEAPSASAIEAYLSDIKTYSWADIPSSHKKISERLREEGLAPSDRVFRDMSEITDEINVNGMKGVRSNRGDLGALRDWLTERGLGGDRLAQVLGTNLNGT